VAAADGAGGERPTTPSLSRDLATVVFVSIRPWPGFQQAWAQSPWAVDGGGVPYLLVFEDFDRSRWSGVDALSDGTLALAASSQDGLDDDLDLYVAAPEAGVVDVRGLLPRTFEAEGVRIQHKAGRATADGWKVLATDGTDTMVYGPYTDEVPAGDHSVRFRIRVDATSASSATAVHLDVHDARYLDLASVDLAWSWFPDTGWHDAQLWFTSDEGAVLEFRAWQKGLVGVEIDRIVVE
jgi:hypothetical protein